MDCRAVIDKVLYKAGCFSCLFFEKNGKTLTIWERSSIKVKPKVNE